MDIVDMIIVVMIIVAWPLLPIALFVAMIWEAIRGRAPWD